MTSDLEIIQDVFINRFSEFTGRKVRLNNIYATIIIFNFMYLIAFLIKVVAVCL